MSSRLPSVNSPNPRKSKPSSNGTVEPVEPVASEVSESVEQSKQVDESKPAGTVENALPVDAAKMYGTHFVDSWRDYELILIDICNGVPVDEDALAMLLKLHNINEREHRRNVDRMRQTLQVVKTVLPQTELASTVEHIEEIEATKADIERRRAEFLAQIESELQRVNEQLRPLHRKIEKHEWSLKSKRECMPDHLKRRMARELGEIDSSIESQELREVAIEASNCRHFLSIRNIKDDHNRAFAIASYFENQGRGMQCLVYPTSKRNDVGRTSRNVIQPQPTVKEGVLEQETEWMERRLTELEARENELRELLEQRRAEVIAKHDAWLPGR